MKLFIADDSEILTNHLVSMLAEVGPIDVIGTADNTDDTIEQVCRIKPDLVILDIRMPGEGGIHALREIKKFDPSIEVAMFTDYPYPQYRTKCAEEGADYFFEKANETEKLIELLKQKVKTA